MDASGKGGRIVNIASLLSFQGGIRVPGYAAAKHGVAGLTKALANEWAPLGIGVNAIAPGYIATDNTAPLRADAERSQNPRPHSGRALGRPVGPRRRLRLPRLARERLCPRPCPHRRRGLDGALAVWSRRFEAGRPLQAPSNGPVSDCTGAAALLDDLPEARRLPGDRGTDADGFRDALAALSGQPGA